MKKLMMVVAVICVTACVQAASLNWISWGYTLSEGATGDEVWGSTDTTAYLIQVTDASTFAVANDLKITGGTIVDSIADDGAGTLSGVWNTDSLANGQDYQFAILVTSKPGTIDNLPTDGYYGVDKNGDTGLEFYTITWDSNTGTGFMAADTFYGVGATTKISGTAGIPEPTSGLLLLVGGALLALRRKQK